GDRTRSTVDDQAALVIACDSRAEEAARVLIRGLDVLEAPRRPEPLHYPWSSDVSTGAGSASARTRSAGSHASDPSIPATRRREKVRRIACISAGRLRQGFCFRAAIPPDVNKDPGRARCT